MDKNHNFIIAPGKWIGEGKISLNMVAEELPFTMNWEISEKDSSGKIHSVQELQIQGLSEGMRNELFFTIFLQTSSQLRWTTQILEKFLALVFLQIRLLPGNLEKMTSILKDLKLINIIIMAHIIFMVSMLQQISLER